MNFKDIFGSLFHEFFLFSFISILEEKVFGESGENIFGLYYLFSFILSIQTSSKNVFFPIFSSNSKQTDLNKTYMSGTQILSRNKKLCISHLCERNEFCKK